jgi:hypothetical protein
MFILVRSLLSWGWSTRRRLLYSPVPSVIARIFARHATLRRYLRLFSPLAIMFSHACSVLSDSAGDHIAARLRGQADWTREQLHWGTGCEPGSPRPTLPQTLNYKPWHFLCHVADTPSPCHPEFAEKILKEPQLGTGGTAHTGILMVYPTCCIHVLEVSFLNSETLMHI